MFKDGKQVGYAKVYDKNGTLIENKWH